MELTSRQRAALSLLLKSPGETTLSQLALRMGVSSRTVHRELSAIAPNLRAAYGLVLAGKTGRGLSIEGVPAQVEACLKDLESPVPGPPSAATRRAVLAACLLDSGEGIKLFALSSEVAAPTTTVRSDLEGLRPWFLSHGVRLVLRRGLGVRLEGPEAALRRAWCGLIVEELGDEGLLSLLRAAQDSGHPPSLFASRILGRFGEESFALAEECLSALPKGSLPPLALSDYLGLVVHLAVAARRMSKLAVSRNLDLVLSGDAISSAASLVAKAASQALGAAFGAEETEALDLYLRGARLESADKDILDLVGMDALESVRALTLELGRLTGLPFEEDRLLRDGLLAHWSPAIFRLSHGLPIRNPLLERIRSAYASLFDAVAQALATCLPGLDFPDDEIAYLVLHFGSSVERRERGHNRFRVLVVCSAGIGSAQMLGSRLRSEFPELEVVGNLSWFDLKDLSRESYDFLVSTVPLPLARSEYVLVSPLLDPEGVETVRQAIHSRVMRHRERGPASQPSAPGPGSPRDLTRALGAVVAMLEGIKVFTVPSSPSSWALLLDECLGRLRDHGLVKDQAQALRDLEERSRDGGILLPGGTVLFLHARSPGVERSSFSLHALPRALGPDPLGRLVEARLLVIMLAPPATSAETQAILNELSVSLLDVQTASALAEVSEASLRAYYARYLDTYIRSA